MLHPTPIARKIGIFIQLSNTNKACLLPYFLRPLMHMVIRGSTSDLLFSNRHSYRLFKKTSSFSSRKIRLMRVCFCKPHFAIQLCGSCYSNNGCIHIDFHFVLCSHHAPVQDSVNQCFMTPSSWMFTNHMITKWSQAIALCCLGIVCSRLLGNQKNVE